MICRIRRSNHPGPSGSDRKRTTRSEFSSPVKARQLRWRHAGLLVAAQLAVVLGVTVMFGVATTRPAVAVAANRVSEAHPVGSASEGQFDVEPTAVSSGATTSSIVEVDGVTFELRGFDDDPKWIPEVSGLLVEAIPQLTELFGEPWPTRAPTVIAESTEADLVSQHGAADSTDGLVLIGPDPQPSDVYHQLAHGWALYGRLTDPWFVEGLAEYAATTLTGETTRPDAVPFPQPLVEWRPAESGESANALDQQGISASYRVIKELFDEIGSDRFSQVFWVVSISGREFELTDWQALVYYADPLHPDDEPVEPEFVADLMKRYVVDDTGAAQIDARASAVADVDALQSAAGDWGLPAPIAYSLEEWDLEYVDQLTGAASATIAARDRLWSAADAVGVSVDDYDESSDFSTAYTEEMFADITARLDAKRQALPTSASATDGHGDSPDDAEATPRTTSDLVLSVIGVVLVGSAVLILAFGVVTGRKRRRSARQAAETAIRESDTGSPPERPAGDRPDPEFGGPDAAATVGLSQE